ncbi:MAG: CRTAC1 family protein [Phaeodactylibacter sp.]|nr:CRTAC1 family protein [Phaeodactylibacter sp.]
MNVRCLFILPALLSALPLALNAQLFTLATDVGDAAADNLPSVGGSWNDLNQDGYPELLVTGFDVGRNNRLYLNQQDGAYSALLHSPFTQTPGTWGSVIGLSGDCDNDGDEDVMLCSYRDNAGRKLPLWLLKNSGAPDYELVPDTAFASPPGSYPTATWVDYDLDGDLDFFAGAANGSTDLFYRNDGNAFTRIDTLSFLQFRSGFITHDSWADLDEDGDLDLYVANYSAPNANTFHRSMLRETGDPNYFLPVQIDGLTGVPGANIGVNWIDYDNDGDLDAYLNHYNARDRFFRNDAGYFFTEITGEPMLDVSAYTNFNIWADFNNDGRLDLALAHQLGGSSKGKVYLNEESGFRLLSTEEAGDFSTAFIAQAQSAGLADHDLDGDVDIYVANTVNTSTPAPNLLFRNETGNRNNWLQIRLKGIQSNPNGYGSKVYVTAVIEGDTVRQMRYVSGGTTSYSFQENTMLHFGLGNAKEALAVEVHWISGTTDICTGISANQRIEIEEASCLASSTKETPENGRDFQWRNLYPNPGGAALICTVVLKKATRLHWRLADENGRTCLSGSSLFTGGMHQVSLPAGGLPAGRYAIELWAGQGKESRWWVKAE